jgi:peptidoglycan/LPS O-acetylase OafA/YrhL
MSELALHDNNAPFSGRTRVASLCSFDLARIAAISLVALQHLLTVSGHRPPLLLGCLNVGQLGVTVLCGLSGYFSMRSSRTTNLGWISRRLNRIFIPYWISLVAIFTANAVVGYKPVSLGLIVSEFAGTALFTHPGSLVGVHVWFISLILMCYAVAVVLRWKAATLPLFVTLAVAAVFCADALVAAHVLSFLAGCSLAKCGVWKRLWPMGMLIVVGCALGIGSLNACFAYPCAATIVVLLCNTWFATSPARLARWSESTYEFFLVHGPIYLGLAKYAHLGIFANAVFGTSLAIIATILLRAAASAISRFGGVVWRHEFFRGMRQPSP